MTPDGKNITSLGYCESPISDFDDVKEIGVVVGRRSKLKIKDGKSKNIMPKARIISGRGEVQIISGGTGEFIEIEDLPKIFPQNLIYQANSALAKNRNSRKEKLSPKNDKID